MALREMQLSDLQLRSCTRWTAPNGLQFLELYKVLAFYETIGAGLVTDDSEISTPPEFPFVVKAIEYTGVTPGTLIQIQWPDGRYLSNPGVDFFSFVGTGRRARHMGIEKVLPPSSKIRFNIDNSGSGSSSEMELYFTGVLRIPLVNA